MEQNDRGMEGKMKRRRNNKNKERVCEWELEANERDVRMERMLR